MVLWFIVFSWMFIFGHHKGRNLTPVTLGVILTPVRCACVFGVQNDHGGERLVRYRCQNNVQSSKSNEIPSGSFLCDDQRWKFKKKQWIITPKVSQHMNLYECPEHVDLSTPCLIILVTINAMDIAWYYGVGGAPMEELILNAQYMWTHPPLV